MPQTPRKAIPIWRRAESSIARKGESPEQLVADILSVGAGLSSLDAARLLSREGPRLVKEILIDELGVPFDSSTENPGQLDLTSEAGHSLPRIIHYKDQSGFAIERAFLDRVRSHPNVKVISHATAVDLLTVSHHSLEPTDVYRLLTCVGAYVLDQTTGKIFSLLAKETILATGGLGSVFLHTTRVYPSKEKIERKDQLAWKIGEIASDSAPKKTVRVLAPHNWFPITE